AQDKTQFRRVTVLIFRIRNTSASAHTNYLVNFLKNVEPLLIKAAYSTVNRHLVNRCFEVIFEAFNKRSNYSNRPACSEERGAHSTVNRRPVNHLFEELENSNFSNLFRQLPLPNRPRLASCPSEVGRILQPSGKLSTPDLRKPQIRRKTPM
ncbi:hypothetical protein QVZ43_08805, partial [Marinobacter sp. chi1]